MWLGQDSLSNPIHPERLSPPPSLVSDFEELHTGKPFAPTRRSQTRAHIRFELVASKLLFVDEHKRDAVTHAARTSLSAAAASKTYSSWEKPDYSMRKAPEGEWSWRVFSRSARDRCLISSERCGKMNMRCISTFFWDFCKFFFSFCRLHSVYHFQKRATDAIDLKMFKLSLRFLSWM